MNKDAVMASIIGFVIGMFITGAIIAGPRITKNLGAFSWPTLPKMSFNFSFLQKKEPKTETTLINDSLSELESEDGMITSPAPQSIVYTDTITITGKAPNASLIVVQGVSEDGLTTATADDTFSLDVPLVEGTNNLTITSYTEGKPTTEGLTVYYAAEEF